MKWRYDGTWWLFLGLGSAGILNSFFVVASGLGHVNLGNLLPALMGALLMGLSVLKLKRGPERPLLGKGIARSVWKGLMILTVGWLAFISWTLAYGWERELPGTPDWILVPGAGLRGDQLSLTLKERLDTALACHQQYPQATLIVSGGQGPDEWIPEAEAMGEYLVWMGVPEARILREAKATSTYENLLFSRELMTEKAGEASGGVLIVTSRYHLARACSLAEDLGLNAAGIPARTPPSVLVGSYLRESLALTKHLITGK